jgi:hypothetical protein
VHHPGEEQQEDRADDGPEDPCGVEGSARLGPVDEAGKRATHEGATDPEQRRREEAHLIRAGHQHTRDKANDEADDE